MHFDIFYVALILTLRASVYPHFIDEETEAKGKDLHSL